MKKVLCLLLALLLCGCGAQAPKEMAVDSAYVIVCDENATMLQAAVSLQSNLKHKHGLELEVVTAAPAEAKTITLRTDSALSAGEYRTRLTEGGVVIEVQSASVMPLAMRYICAGWPADNKLTAEYCAASLSGAYPLEEAPFLVLTQNIRFDNDGNGNNVIDRAPRFNQLVQQYIPDIMCIQEDNRYWAPIMDKFFGELYTVFGEYSGGADTTKGNRQSIYFRTDRYEPVENGALWLSDTPTEPMTKFEDSKSVRHCTWVLLKDKYTGRELFVCDIHLDNTTNEVRLAQLEVLYEHLSSYMETYPTIMCGDFNARPDSGVYAEVTKTFQDPHVTAGAKPDFTEYSFTRYGTAQFGTDDEPRRLDYLFYNDRLIAQMYRIMTDTYDGYISDHFGAMTEYSFAE